MNCSWKLFNLNPNDNANLNPNPNPNANLNLNDNKYGREDKEGTKLQEL